MSFRDEALKERIEQVRPKIAKARELAELAESENREMTAEEQKTFDEIMAEGRSVADAVKQKRHDDFVWNFARTEFGGEGELSRSGIVDKTRRLSFKGMGSQVAARMLPDGMKSLAPFGVAVVGQEMKPDPVALGQPALSLLDVIPVVTHSSREFGKSAYRNTKGRRVSGLSIGYAIRNSTKTAAGNELTDDSPQLCAFTPSPSIPCR